MLAILLGLAVLIVLPSVSCAQSKADAARLHKEALALQEKARSNEDLKMAVQKYEEALKIYQRVGEAAGCGAVKH